MTSLLIRCLQGFGKFFGSSCDIQLSRSKTGLANYSNEDKDHLLHHH